MWKYLNRTRGKEGISSFLNILIKIRQKVEFWREDIVESKISKISSSGLLCLCLVSGRLRSIITSQSIPFVKLRTTDSIKMTLTEGRALEIDIVNTRTYPETLMSSLIKRFNDQILRQPETTSASPQHGLPYSTVGFTKKSIEYQL